MTTREIMKAALVVALMVGSVPVSALEGEDLTKARASLKMRGVWEGSFLYWALAQPEVTRDAPGVQTLLEPGRRGAPVTMLGHWLEKKYALKAVYKKWRETHYPAEEEESDPETMMTEGPAPSHPTPPLAASDQKDRPLTAEEIETAREALKRSGVINQGFLYWALAQPEVKAEKGSPVQELLMPEARAPVTQLYHWLNKVPGLKAKYDQLHKVKQFVPLIDQVSTDFL